MIAEVLVMWVFTLLLLMAGLVGVVYQCVRFVTQTIPHNYGNNPGFGVLEVAVMPWHAMASVGIGFMLESKEWGVAVFVIGILCIGAIVTLLSRLFGREL